MARPEENINYSNVHTIPNNLKQLFEYNGDGTVKYAGHAKRGSTEGDLTAWTIQFFEYNATPAVTSITVAYHSWTLRSSASYA